MKARARELAVCVPYVKPSVDSHARSDLCLSPPILSPQSSYQPPQPDAAIRLGPKFQVSTVPAYQGPSCTDACERGDQLLTLAEVELALARATACRITAAAFHEPGVRLDLVKGEWLAVPRRRRQPSYRSLTRSGEVVLAELDGVTHWTLLERGAAASACGEAGNGGVLARARAPACPRAPARIGAAAPSQNPPDRNSAAWIGRVDASATWLLFTDCSPPAVTGDVTAVVRIPNGVRLS